MNTKHARPRRLSAFTAVAWLALLRQPLKLMRGNDVVFLRVRLVVVLDIRESIEVVGGHPKRAAHPGLGRVAHPVETLQTRAVGQMKPRHGVERRAAALRVQ